jgi:hypothetical protein
MDPEAMKKIVIALLAILVSSPALCQGVSILKSRVDSYPGGFDEAVKRLSSERKLWREHMARVEEDKKNNVPKEKAYAPFPEPHSDADVEAAASGGYTVTDDTPSPVVVLAAKKEELSSAVEAQEVKMVDAIVSPSKRKLAYAKFKGIQKKDATAISSAKAEEAAASADYIASQQAESDKKSAIAASAPGVMGSIANSITGKKFPAASDETELSDLTAKKNAKAARRADMEKRNADSEGVAKAARSPEDEAFVEAHLKREATIEAIHTWAAEQKSAIEDLTDANVDSWKISPAP